MTKKQKSIFKVKCMKKRIIGFRFVQAYSKQGVIVNIGMIIDSENNVSLKIEEKTNQLVTYLDFISNKDVDNFIESFDIKFKNYLTFDRYSTISVSKNIKLSKRHEVSVDIDATPEEIDEAIMYYIKTLAVIPLNKIGIIIKKQALQ